MRQLYAYVANESTPNKWIAVYMLITVPFNRNENFA